LTAQLDRALLELSEAIAGEPAAVVAVGGYGRREMAPHSDVDVMLLHDGADTDRLAKAVLYPLWDAGLKVGHSVRTVREAVAAARDNLATATSLLTARRVAGSEELVAALEQGLSGHFKGRPLASLLAAEEKARRAAEPYPVMDADLKNGRGGLRTFAGFMWERRRASLIGRDAQLPETPAEGNAHNTLLALRNALHATSGRVSDRFVFDLRGTAAAWLGMDVAEAAERMCAALRVGDRLAERCWPDLTTITADPMVAFGRRVFGAIKSRFTSESTATAGASPLAVAARAASRPEGVWLAPVERDALTAPPMPWTADDRAAFVGLLSAGPRGMAAFELLDESGWLARELPEVGAVIAAPHLAPMHRHPVDSHLWRTVDEALALAKDPNPVLAGVMTELGATEELALAAFFHDIGKGAAGDHSVVGAEIVESLFARAGFGPATTATVAAAVRHHLLLVRVATRRDLADDSVVDDVADLVDDPRLLQLLLLLTVADSRATGPRMWTPWKERLVVALYRRVGERLGVETGPPDVDVAAVVAVAEGEVSRRQVEEHVAAMPPDYLVLHEATDVLRHLELLEGGGLRVALLSAEKDGIATVFVTGPDRVGFLSAVAGAMALNQVSILEARLLTRADGAAVDTFKVTHTLGSGVVDGARLHRVEEDLREILGGGRDLTAELAAKARSYRDHAAREVPERVDCRLDPSGRWTVVEVRCGDRIGRLQQIVEVMARRGLDVHYAKIDTRGDEVIDTFHVRDSGGHPVRDPALLEDLAAAVRAAVAET
jgi:[protein-PII] uridylyltransferase